MVSAPIISSHKNRPGSSIRANADDRRKMNDEVGTLLAKRRTSVRGQVARLSRHDGLHPRRRNAATT
jgi:hypothetical protein